MTSVPSDLATGASFMESVRLSENRVSQGDSYRFTNTITHICGQQTLFESCRCEGDVSRSDSDSAEARKQSGHPVLCHEFTAQLVQR